MIWLNLNSPFGTCFLFVLCALCPFLSFTCGLTNNFLLCYFIYTIGLQAISLVLFHFLVVVLGFIISTLFIINCLETILCHFLYNVRFLKQNTSIILPILCTIVVYFTSTYIIKSHNTLLFALNIYLFFQRNQNIRNKKYWHFKVFFVSLCRSKFSSVIIFFCPEIVFQYLLWDWFTGDKFFQFFFSEKGFIFKSYFYWI